MRHSREVLPPASYSRGSPAAVSLARADGVAGTCCGREVAEQHEAVWARDRVANLVVRLRHNVIRAGLRRINIAYWRISLSDIASKLGELPRTPGSVEMCQRGLPHYVVIRQHIGAEQTIAGSRVNICVHAVQRY